MKLMRSRQIVASKPSPKTITKGISIEPSTPAQTREPSSMSSPHGGLVSASIRRSLRLASKADSCESRKRKSACLVDESMENLDACVLDPQESNKVQILEVQEESAKSEMDSVPDKVSDVSGIELGFGQRSGNIVITNEEIGKRKFNIVSKLSGLENEGTNGFLNLRSGKRIFKGRYEGTNRNYEGSRQGEYGLLSSNGNEEAVVKEFIKESTVGEEEKDDKLVGDDLVSVGVDVVELAFETESKKEDGSDPFHGIKRRDKKEKRITTETAEGVVDEEQKKIQDDGDNASVKGRRRLSREEKGKGEMVYNALLSNGNPTDELGATNLTGCLAVKDAMQDIKAVNESSKKAARQDVKSVNESRGKEYMDRFRDIARQNASRFAHFSSQDEENGLNPEAQRATLAKDEEEDVEDWPGPFSTAMKIIKDRAKKLNLQPDNSSLGRSKPLSFMWVPKKSLSCERLKPAVPLLQELCIRILANNADAITSLQNVPDELRHKLTQILCDSRRMSGHYLDILVSGSPSEVCLRDCSWLTEEQFTKSFEACNTNNLMVLQLDQCGRCMPDYILRSTLARSSNSLPALTTLSLTGACRLSDVGLSALVSSAPALRCINLSQCSLLTSAGINALADSLGSVLRELYINDCESIDAMLIISALRKLEHLEVLSLAGIQTVCDEFIKEYITVHGHYLKELVLTDCVKLTDSSLKVIGETCSGLHALDLVNLCKLTDSAIRYLADGCREIQKLKFRRNAFSDDAIAAFMETSGEFLEDLSLNNVKKVGHNTALSLARRSRKLISLDLSWCRNLTDEAVVLIVDSCLTLRVLKLFGCTQITNVFLDGHSNPEVHIIGLNTGPLLEHL